jgi:DnaJ-class molecular chaperone
MNVLQILNLTPGCTVDEAKKSFRKLSLRYHPDKNKSPDAIRKFQEISAAYRSICSNPTLLNPKKLEKFKGKGFIQTSLNVTTEDIYFYREHSLRIDRLVACDECGATGCKDGKDGLCGHCGGDGQVGSKILKLMGKYDSVCPVCKGTGRKSSENCSKCLGNKYNIDRQIYKVKIGLKDYHKGVKVLRGFGNEYSPGKFSDVHVRLAFFTDTSLSIEDYEFIKNIAITPTQNIIGDEQTVSVYGKNITYKIIPGEPEFEYTDSRPGMPERKIRFVYTERKPRVIDETRILYQKIMKIERVLGLIKDEDDKEFTPI